MLAGYNPYPELDGLQKEVTNLLKGLNIKEAEWVLSSVKDNIKEDAIVQPSTLLEAN